VACSLLHSDSAVLIVAERDSLSSAGSSVRRVILHVDMDAFYASVERRQNPALAGQPIIVGADPKGGEGRGVVAGCSYEARKFGVHSAQPISRAYRLCPQGVYLRPNFALYEEVSARIMDILRTFSDRLEPMSLDEAFLDLSEKAVDFNEATEIARSIKDEIKAREGLTCSIGVAPNKAIAKIASDYQKPDGLTCVTPDRATSFLAPLPVSRISGVGKKSTEILGKVGIKTIGDLASYPSGRIVELFGKWGISLWEIANGVDETPVVTSYGIKSISTETTFEQDIEDRRVVLETLDRLAKDVHARATQDGFLWRTVGIKLRFEDFSTFTRAKSRSDYTNRLDVVQNFVRSLFSEFGRDPRRIRLVGVRLSNLRRTDLAQESLLAWSENR
jgi:DNA polymerase IV (DinB-like DNA polymerase)